MPSAPHAPLPRPIDHALRRTLADALADGVVTRDEVAAVAALAQDSRGGVADVRATLQAFTDAHRDRFESPEARAAAEALARSDGGPMTRPSNALFEVRAAPGENCARKQALYLRGTGALTGDTGLPSFSRGWAQLNRGVLREEHGSRPPSSAVLDAGERAALVGRTPAQRLDRASELLRGGPVGMSSFSALAESRVFANPDEPDFAGFCYAWAWAALDARLTRLVDVEGPEQMRGLWIAGEWLSRADLGNWLMCLLAGLSQGAGDVMWYSPEAEDLLKAGLGYLMEGGRGFRADIGPALDPPSEIWFQPFVGADVAIEPVPAGARGALLELARQPVRTAYGTVAPGVEGADVVLVRLSGKYGDEVGDDHEGSPALAVMAWAAYAVVDGEGKMLKAYLASDPRLDGVPGLPERVSRALPRELFAPDHELVDGILRGEPSSEVRDSVFGPQLDFLVGTVLARGVPGALRAAFEREPALRRPGAVPPAELRRLAERYPTVANAYSEAQWARAFAGRGLARADFGGLG